MWRIVDFFGKNKPLPWSGRPTIYDALRVWDGQADLPDEDPARGRIRFSTGALDNVRLRHFGLDSDPQTSRLFRALERAATTRLDADRATLYRLMAQHGAVDHAEALAERVQSSSLDCEAVAELARVLLAEAADREPVKYALALIGRCGSPRDAELVMTFARHDEFTMYASPAIERVSDDPLAAELAMAEQVDGWGKITLVERIAQRGSDRADVRDWLLRRGCENAVMDEYLAYACATAGRLHEALAAETIDAELRAGACTIVSALIVGGPAEDMDDYDHGPAAVEHLLRHLEGTSDPNELAVIATVARWLGYERDWSVAEARGWSSPVRERIAAQAEAILTAEEVEDRLRASFRSDDPGARFAAWNAASAAGVDLWEEAFELARREPLTSYLYHWLARTSDPMRLRRTITLAEEHLPLDRIATGPANDFGLGEGFEPHSCLDMVLQELPASGQFSARLVAAGLRSPVTRNRNMAKRAMEHTPPADWGSELREVLARAAEEEPNDELRRDLHALLARR
jgi:hypothetical protein